MAPTLKIALATLSFFAVGNTQTAGYGQEHNFIGETRTFSIQSSGGDRSFSVHLPDNYVPDDARPLLLAYHGRGGTSKGMEDITRFSNPGVNPDMITVYPQGVNVSFSLSTMPILDLRGY
jgi:poly(3-hydroxybutyrate) depolymerase